MDVLRVHKLPASSASNIFTHNISHCADCFTKKEQCSALTISNFDLLKEWVLNVPLPVKAFLENAFINKRTVSTVDKERLQRKMGKLYLLHDALTKVRNSQHIGVMQEMFSLELAIDYANLDTVFGATSTANMSRSRSGAEDVIHRLSQYDKIAYDVFIRSHPLKCKSHHEDNESTKLIQFKDCHCIFEIDNLVKLTQHCDPARGHTHYTSIPTLPMTLKGVPKDHHAISQWHQADCDGSLANCTCKDRQDLRPEDVHPVLFDVSEEQEVVGKQFRKYALLDETICDMRR